jgi:hypothetical protein
MMSTKNLSLIARVCILANLSAMLLAFWEAVRGMLHRPRWNKSALYLSQMWGGNSLTEEGDKECDEAVGLCSESGTEYGLK